VTPVYVVGIGADGWDGLTEQARAVVCSARVVLGAHRHLDMLPEMAGQRRVAWPSPLRDQLPELLRHLDMEPGSGALVALATGDPLLAGIGSTLVNLLGPDAVTVVPAVSSAALARARLRWPAESVEILRDPGTVVRHLAPGRRILVLSTDASTPATVARALCERGFGASRLTVLANLGAADESTRATTAAAWSGAAQPLHVLAVECLGAVTHGLLAGLPDDAFEHDGQLTKRDLRASALARLAPQPGQLLWDVGAGAGSVAIEWMRAHPICRAVAIERSPPRAQRIERNATRLGVPALRVVTGDAPEALGGLPTPDGVFVGGGATVPGLIDACWSALPPGGRLVAHAVTLESELVLSRQYGERGGELTRVSVEHAAPLGGLTGWAPARAVTQWAVTKP
jgi:precorrin-6Y C5,15-methyltransferase (decarboxylating)